MINIEGHVDTSPKEFENAQLYFYRASLSSTLILHENGAFLKHTSNRRNFKTPALRSGVDGTHFENGAFQTQWFYDTNMIFLLVFLR